jgi:hypothetical protein
MHASATFTLANPTEGPLFDPAEGLAPTGTRGFDKTFVGEIDATSTVRMLAAGDPTAGGAGYVALEQIVGSVNGAAGSFVLLHVGTMDSGSEPWAMWPIAPGTGTGELAGITGSGAIRFADDGTHLFDLDYELPDPAA